MNIATYDALKKANVPELDARKAAIEIANNNFAMEQALDGLRSDIKELRSHVDVSMARNARDNLIATIIVGGVVIGFISLMIAGLGVGVVIYLS